MNIDFETRSTVDLRRCGIYCYAENPDTSVLCLGWAIDGAEPQVWVPGTPLPPDLLAACRHADMRAFNVQFERTIWDKIMVPRHHAPKIPLARWFCTASDAAAMALPRSLDKCAAVLGVVEQKDTAAWRLVVKLSRPRRLVNGRPEWWEPQDVPELYEKLYEYNRQDVRTEQALMRATRRLDPTERKIFLLDQKVNEAGVCIDLELARAMRRISQRGLEDANADLRATTGGAVSGVTKIADLKAWLGEQGVVVESVRKSVVRDMLEGEQADPVRRALEARADAGRSSVSKIDAIEHFTCADGRARGMLLYFGANTGRWAGRGPQPQNFPRPVVPDPQQWIPDLLSEAYETINLFEAPLAVVASNLRAVFRASPGHVLRAGDFSGVEARVLNWLAGQQDMVALFASGGKVYEKMAGRIYNIDPATITKDDPRRQVGKNTELGCGYQMGGEKFRATVLEQEGVDLGEELANDAVGAYRELHPFVVRLWRALEGAALTAVAEPGKMAQVRGCRFIVRGAYLWLLLPSGRPLAYAAPRIKSVLTKWNEQRDQVTAESVDSKTKVWTRRSYYGGLWTENIVQALARDLLAQAMLRADAAGHRIVLTVHDEIVADDPVGFSSLPAFLDLMKVVPDWAKGCPVNADGYEAQRYRK